MSDTTNADARAVELTIAPGRSGTPAPPKYLVARESELSRLLARLEERGVAALNGLPGSGKTALAASAAAAIGRPTIWLELLSEQVATGVTFSRQLGERLGQTQWTGRTRLTERQSATSPSTLLAELRLALELLGRSGPAPLLCVDRVELCAGSSLEVVLAGLCDTVAYARRSSFSVLIVGRTLPWPIYRYALPPLDGLDAQAIAAWARELGLSPEPTAAAALQQATGGLPGAVEPVLRALAEGRPGAGLLASGRRLFAELFLTLPTPQRALAAAIAARADPYLIAADETLAAYALEHQGLLSFVGDQVALHPLLRSSLQSGG